MRFSLSSLILLCSLQLFSQQINGIWNGKMYYPNTRTDTVFVKFEITGKNNNKLSGFTICYFDEFNYARTSISGKYDTVKHEVYIEEKSIIEERMRESVPIFLDEYYLNVDSKGKLTGIVRCKKLSHNVYDNAIPCHDDMYIDLVRQ